MSITRCLGALFSSLCLKPQILHHPLSEKLPVTGIKEKKIIANHTALEADPQTLLLMVHQPKHTSWSWLTANGQTSEAVNQTRNTWWMSLITIVSLSTKYSIYSPSYRQYVLTPPWRRKNKCHVVRTASSTSRSCECCTVVPTSGRNVLRVWLLLNQNPMS